MTNDTTPRQRVLVVNDTQEILELFEEILEAMGLEVVQMSYAPRELARIRDTAPDLVVLDFLMGDRELLGWQLLQKLKMDRSLSSLPVIVCTGAVKQVQEQQGYLTEQGVIVVLKPFQVEQLEEAVRQALTMGPTAHDLRAEAEGSSASRGRPES